MRIAAEGLDSRPFNDGRRYFNGCVEAVESSPHGCKIAMLLFKRKLNEAVLMRDNSRVIFECEEEGEEVGTRTSRIQNLRTQAPGC